MSQETPDYVTKLFEKIDRLIDAVNEIKVNDAKTEARVAALELENRRRDSNCSCHVDQIDNLESRISEIESTKIRATGWIAGVSFAGAAFMSLILWIINKIFTSQSH